MESIFLGIVLGLLIFVPLAVKWELELKPVIIAGIVVGFFSGVVIYFFSLIFHLGLVLRLLATSILIVCTGTAILLTRFYRDPERSSKQSQNHITSPADGVIKYVKPIGPSPLPLSSKGDEHVELAPAFLRILPTGKGYLVGISMSFLDVHVTRAPIDGHVTFFEHVAGTFLSLKRSEALQKNERLNEVIANDGYSVGLIHIASRLVRLIVSYAKLGDRLLRGQRIGMIKFGSQVDLILPDHGNLKIEVAVGQKVVAGETTIALVRVGDAANQASE